MDYAIRSNAKGQKIMGLVVGCFLDPKQFEDYAGHPGNALWHRGLVTLKNVSNGSFDLETIGIKALERAYGK